MDRPVDEIRNRKANLSKLMAEKLKSSQHVPKMCPFCNDSEEGYDQYGYCHHLIGFTVPGDNTQMYPFLAPRRRKNADIPVVGEGLRVVHRKIVPVPNGAKLERITVNSRVYVQDRTPFPPYVPPPETEPDEPEVIELEKANKPLPKRKKSA